MAEQRVPLPAGLATGVGSLPHCDPGEAVEFVLRHSPRLPYAPSLPARSRREGMIAQAAAGVAGVTVGDDGSLAVDLAAVDPEAPLAGEGFSGDAYVGLRAFLSAVADGTGPLKVSLTGPVTLGMGLHAAGLPAPLAFQVAGAVVRRRAAALVDLVVERVPQAEVVAFLDEPSLVAVTQPGFPLAPVAAVDLVSGALASIEARATTGLHCCGPADWRLVLQAGPRLLSAPVASGLAASPGTVADFLDRGGWIAWGAVPTDRPVGSTVDRLWRQLGDEWTALIEGGCDPFRLRLQSMVTPACGLVQHGVPQAEQVMAFTSRLAARLHEQTLGMQLSAGA
jgi:hypothetical protein